MYLEVHQKQLSTATAGKRKKEAVRGQFDDVLEEIEDTEEQSLVEVRKLKETYKEVFDDEGELKPMLSDPYKIELRNDIPIKPIHVNVPRRTPYAFQDTAKKKIETLVREGVLEYVEGSSEWISPCSFVPKPDGDVRMVADLVHLNKFVMDTGKWS